jgi:hypothetical protein
MTDKIDYSIARTVDDIEIRKYPNVILATVRGYSDNEAFGILFDYIAGSNRIRKKIEMTAPVISSEKIPMTAPVVSGTGSFSFVLPSSYSMDTVPEPLDGRAKIEEIKSRHVAVIRFRGYTSDKNVKSKTKALLDKLGKNGIDPQGEPFLMRYNPPFTPGFMRRNELGVEVSI